VESEWIIKCLPAAYLCFMTMTSALERIYKPGRMTVGIELPLDNDWSPDGEARRIADGRPRGVPSLAGQTDLIRQIDKAGFAAIWSRDVPVFDQVNMGDAGSVHDLFVFLGYLAGITRYVALGTAATVLPIRHPLMTAKAAASVDALSGGRLILGVASGDRPVEYPLLGLDFESRGQAFREAVEYMRNAWQSGGLPVNGERVPTLDLLPRPAQASIPLIAAGRAQQSETWLRDHLDGRFAYPATVSQLVVQASEWASATDGERPFISAFHLDLLDDPYAPSQPIRFGARAGRKALIDHLHVLRRGGVHHMAINLRQSTRPLTEVIDELASDILPALDENSAARAA
jgi:luciferase-type oxidoreductase